MTDGANACIQVENGKYKFMKNILVVAGRGRPKGNTAQRIDAFIKGAEAARHSVENIFAENGGKGLSGV